MVVGSNISNFFAYAYNFLFFRLLGSQQYGELVSILAVLGLLTSMFSFFGVVITKFVSSSNEDQTKATLSWFERTSNFLALGISLLLFISSYGLAVFLKLDLVQILLLIPLIFLSVKNLLYKSFMNGLLRFKEVVISTNVDMILRLSISAVLVLIGLKVFGALIGFILATALGILFSKYLIRDVKYTDEYKNFKNSKEVLSFNFPVFLNSLAIMSFFTFDVILVKHFFTSNSSDVGIYASLSNMGKIIFYALAPVSAVMFPLISKENSKGKSTRNIFYLSLFLISSGIAVVLFSYKFYPEIILNLLWGSQALSGSRYLFSFGLIMSIFSLNNLVVNYFVSKGVTYPVSFAVLGSVFQVIGISFYHKGISDIITVSFVSVLIFSTGLIIYMLYEVTQSRR